MASACSKGEIAKIKVKVCKGGDFWTRGPSFASLGTRLFRRAQRVWYRDYSFAFLEQFFDKKCKALESLKVGYACTFTIVAKERM